RAAASLHRPTTPLIEGYFTIEVRTGFRELYRFLLAALRTSLQLRRKSLDRIINRERRLKEKARSSPTNFAATAERLERCMATFLRLRPLIFTAHDRCLFDSLALKEFLRLHGIFPDLIFGVRSDPFSAHCWLQHREIVINDDPENVQDFTPIMVV